MAGVTRSGFQALANAVWSLVALASRTVHLGAGSPGTIKVKIQATATITDTNVSQTYSIGFTVDEGKSSMTHLGLSGVTGGGADYTRVELLDSGNIRVYRTVSAGTSQIGFQLIEEY